MAHQDFSGHQGRVIADPYDVDVRLARLGLSADFLILCADRGDLARRSIPPFGFNGQAEYDAASQVLSTICEEGGTTDGGWHRGSHLGIPVAFNYDETIAITPTAGDVGTGRPDGNPVNASLKGPSSRKASSPLAQGAFDFQDPDNQPVDFWWFFTRRDPEGLWAEMFAPIFDKGGTASGYTERVVIGQIGPMTDPSRLHVPPAGPTPSIDITVLRRNAS